MRGRPVVFKNFSRGLNLADSPYGLQDGEARLVQNVNSSGRGQLFKRPGSTTFATLASSVGSLFAGFSPEILIAQVGTSIQRIDSAGTVTTPLTGLTNAPWEWQAAPSVPAGAPTQGPYYGANGTNDRWVSATAAGNWTRTGSTAGVPKYLRYVANRMICAGGSAFPSRVEASKILDPTVFTSPDGWAVDFDASDGLPITGIGTLGPYLLVFKEHKTWLVFNLDTGASRRLSDGVGAVSHRSIVEMEGRTLFLGRDGIYQATGERVERISRRIDPLIARITPSELSKAAGAAFNGHYYLSIATDDLTEPNLVIDYDTTIDSFWLHTFPVRQFAVWRRAAGEHLMGATADPNIPTQIHRLLVPGTVRDGASLIPYAYWVGPHHDFGAPNLRKRMRQISMEGRGRFDALYSRDFGTDTVGLNYNDTGVLKLSRIYTPGVARTWSMRFESNFASPMEVVSYTMNIDARRN